MGSAAEARRAWTYGDLVALADDQLRHELIDGVHVVSPSPSTAHQEISLNLVRVLLRYLDRHDLGRLLYAPFDVKLSLVTVLVPDLVYFTAERFARVVNEKHATAAPDLVVEILSPEDRMVRMLPKIQEYLSIGTEWIWVIDPEECTVLVWRFADGASAPLALGTADTLRWQPLASGLLLEISVAELLRA